MKLSGATVLITGANRGLGLAFAREALARGAKKVYAGARHPASVTLPSVIPIQLDVTKQEDIVAAAKTCGDVTILINNAGIAEFGGYFNATSIAAAQRHLNTNLFGPWLLTRAFAPLLAAHGGGAILNVLSVASWINGPQLGNYGVSKSAAWAMTNGTRIELQTQNTQVLALHAGFIDTDMTHGIDQPKSSPEDIVAVAFDGLEAGLSEVLADDISRRVHAGLSGTPASYLPAILG